jgi:hypothetical protein
MANDGGDCYEAAGRFMMGECQFGNPCEGLTLVHGEVAGQGELEGVTFGHAWIEKGDTVIDKSNGRNLELPAALYYFMGRINDIGNTHRYPWEEARRMILDYQHWGPWDLETESGL